MPRERARPPPGRILIAFPAWKGFCVSRSYLPTEGARLPSEQTMMNVLLRPHAATELWPEFPRGIAVGVMPPPGTEHHHFHIGESP